MMNHRLPELIQTRTAAKAHIAWVRSRGYVNFDRRLLVRGLYTDPRKKWKLHMSTGKVDHAVITKEDNGYLVSVLKYPNQNKDSYVEVLIAPGHEMYNRFDETVSVLNIAGEQQEVAGIGECFTQGAYHIVLTPDEHAKLLES